MFGIPESITLDLTQTESNVQPSDALFTSDTSPTITNLSPDPDTNTQRDVFPTHANPTVAPFGAGLVTPGVRHVIDPPRYSSMVLDQPEDILIHDNGEGSVTNEQLNVRIAYTQGNTDKLISSSIVGSTYDSYQDARPGQEDNLITNSAQRTVQSSRPIVNDNSPTAASHVILDETSIKTINTAQFEGSEFDSVIVSKDATQLSSTVTNDNVQTKGRRGVRHIRRLQATREDYEHSRNQLPVAKPNTKEGHTSYNVISTRKPLNKDREEQGKSLISPLEEIYGNYPAANMLTNLNKPYSYNNVFDGNLVLCGFLGSWCAVSVL